MAANAKLHVSGFDQKWTPEFERYKERMKARKAERDKRKAEKGKEKDAENGNLEDGPGLAESGSLKRVREEDGEERRPEKRQKDDEGMDGDDLIVDSGWGFSASLATIPPPIPFNHSTSATIESIQNAFSASATVPSTRPPPPNYPPFIIPQAQVAQLAAQLKHTTSQLNVDQLEQLRAGCFDKVWRRRGDWDRKELVKQLEEAVKEFVGEVEKAGEEDDDL